MSKRTCNSKFRNPITDNLILAHSNMGDFIRGVIKSLKHQLKFVSDLPKQLKDSLLWYTSDINYKKFNYRIRNNLELNREYQYHKDNLEYIFNRIPKLKNSITVYRGVKNKNQIIGDKTYLSTSISYQVAKKFSNKCCIIAITLPVGSRVIPLFNLSEFSEGEILLDKGSITILTDKYINKDKYTIYSSLYLPTHSIKMTDSNMIEINKDYKESTAHILPMPKSNFVNRYSKLKYDTLPVNANASKLKKMFVEYVKTLPYSIPEKKNNIRIMSYNIHNGFYDVYNKKTFSDIIKMIDDLDVDIVCFQEITWNYIDKRELIDHMFDIGFIYNIKSKASDIYNNGFYGNYIFCKENIDIIDSYSLKLKKADEEGRSSVVMTFKIKNKNIKLYNTHLDVNDESGLTRDVELSQIMNDTNKKNNIILGDFNTTREDDYPEKYLNWLIAHQASVGKNLLSNSLDIFENNKYIDVMDIVNKQVPITSWSGKRIDYAFISEGDIKVKNAFIVPVLFSDHLPICFDFNVK